MHGPIRYFLPHTHYNIVARDLSKKKNVSVSALKSVFYIYICVICIIYSVIIARKCADDILHINRSIKKMILINENSFHL